jgi:hypothetical protein
MVLPMVVEQNLKKDMGKSSKSSGPAGLSVVIME